MLGVKLSLSLLVALVYTGCAHLRQPSELEIQTYRIYGSIQHHILNDHRTCLLNREFTESELDGGKIKAELTNKIAFELGIIEIRYLKIHLSNSGLTSSKLSTFEGCTKLVQANLIRYFKTLREDYVHKFPELLRLQSSVEGSGFLYPRLQMNYSDGRYSGTINDTR